MKTPIPTRATKSPSAIATFFHTEDIWQELVDPSEVDQDSGDEEVEDHQEWDDREDEKDLN